MNPLDLEAISLRINIENNVVVSAQSSGNKLRGYEKAFLNRKVKELRDIIPRVLATCSQSHVSAFTRAVGTINHNSEILSRIAVSLEIIESHIKHPYIYWFPYIGDKNYDFPSGERFKRIIPFSKKVKEIMEKMGGKWPYTNYLNKGFKVKLSKDDIEFLRKVVEDEVIGMKIEDFLSIDNIDELGGDLTLLKKVPYWTAGLGKYLVVGFPYSATIDLSKLKDTGLDVTYNGGHVEVGPLAQALTFDSMVKKLHEKYGPSPLLREISRIKVACKLLSELAEFDGETDGYEILGSGIGMVESIRGSLLHKVSINEDKAIDYSIIQPTSFNASPGGALEYAVKGIPVKDPKNPWEISLAVSSLDSCFVTEVIIYEGGKLISKKRIGGFC
jgi:hydrogenase large subunit